MISARQISKEFTTPSGRLLAVLQDIDLDIGPRTLTLISGPSGIGKSTLLQILGLLDSPSKGEYFLDGNPVDFTDADYLAAIRGSTFGFVFQDFNLLVRRTAWENVISPLDYVSRKETISGIQRARELMDELEIAKRSSHFPQQLSVGERQRVALARALVRRPRILFADEPTGSLDETLAKRLADLFAAQASSTGMAVVIVSHDLDLWQPLVDKHWTLQHGTLLSRVLS